MINDVQVPTNLVSLKIGIIQAKDDFAEILLQIRDRFKVTN